MYIESIELKNYRNYETLSLKLDEGTNIFYGDNAQGKTNILEAAYLCGTTKSHRGSKDRDLIKFDSDEAHIRMFVKKNGISRKIDMHLKKTKAKGIAIDGIPIKKAGELFGIVNMVFFSPEDLNIIKNGPGERRRFMDLELCQLNKLYLSNLSSYNRILNQRNKLLKDISFNPSLMSTLEVWDEQLAVYGSAVIEGRMGFIEEIHSNITGGKEKIELIYEPSTDRGQFLEELSRNREKDCRFKMTSTGPHRDDLCVRINGMDIRKYGSQGQQRSGVLALKMAECGMVEEVTSETPVVLLDDVMSELDAGRRDYLLNHLENQQVFVTCCDEDSFRGLKSGKRFLIQSGELMDTQTY